MCRSHQELGFEAMNEMIVRVELSCSEQVQGLWKERSVLDNYHRGDEEGPFLLFLAGRSFPLKSIALSF